jgi:hypothetical protein
MKSIISVFLACIVLFSCQKEISITDPGSTAQPVTATLQGNVVDENGDPAAGVSIKVGSKTATTDTRGYFRIKDASLDKSVSLVTAEKAGYFKSFRVFSATNAVNHVQIKLVPKQLSGSFNSSAGGTVSLSNGSTVVFSANSFSTASGNSYAGTVNIYAAYIDPTAQDIGETVPGSFLADDQDNKRVILSSYGMMAVEIESTAGEKLQIASGKTAELNFSIPSALQSSAPATIKLWYVDQTTGRWKEEGSATKNGNIYTGTVKHFTYWNCDLPGPTVNLSATFLDQNGQPLVFANVVIRPPGSGLSAHGYTDSLGFISGPVPANVNQVLELWAPGPCYNVIYTQNIGPFSSNVNLGTITVNNSQSLLTVQGRLLNCSNNPVTQGYALIQYDNTPRSAQVNSNGNFSISFATCGSLPTTLTVIGVDNQAQQQSPSVTVPITLPVTNTGDIVACGTSTLQFMNYSVDATAFNLSSTTPGDTFMGIDSSVGPNHVVSLSGTRSQAQRLLFTYQSNGSAGNFTVDYLQVNTTGAIIIQPFNIVITNHPPLGGYFEGSLSGQFKDAMNVTHSLNGTFRVRRTQ